MRADEVPSQADLKTAQSVDDARKKLRLQRDEIAAAAGLRGVLKK